MPGKVLPSLLCHIKDKKKDYFCNAGTRLIPADKSTGDALSRTFSLTKLRWRTLLRCSLNLSLRENDLKQTKQSNVSRKSKCRFMWRFIVDRSKNFFWQYGQLFGGWAFLDGWWTPPLRTVLLPARNVEGRWWWRHKSWPHMLVSNRQLAHGVRLPNMSTWHG